MHKKKTYKVNVVLKKDLTVLVVVVVVDMTSGSSKKLLVSNYSRNSTYGHLSTMAISLWWPVTFVLADSPYNASYLNLSIMATYRKRQWLNDQFFQWLMEISGMVMKFDSHGTLMINHGNHILIVIHLYCSSKYIQLCRARLSEKVHATMLNGIVCSTEFTVFQRNLK